MPWFKVDDSFASHPKVLATDPAALGLWVVAGAWSSAHLTEGHVPDHALGRLLPDSAKLASSLVSAGLWKRVRGGYQFHDWTDYNPSKDAVKSERKSNAERQKRWRDAQRNGRRNAVTNGVTNSAPTRPDPTHLVVKEGDTAQGGARASPEPPNRCPEHIDTIGSPPCGACRDARLIHDRWQAERNQRQRQLPRCRRHPTEPRDHCRDCRSERIAKGDTP